MVSSTPARFPARLVALIAGALPGALVVSGCTGGDPQPPTPSASAAAPTSATATPLATYDQRGLSVARQELCSLIPHSAVNMALGGPAATSATHGSGDEMSLGPQVRDVAHEYGCAWRAADGTLAQAWVFAPPVTSEQATTYAAAAQAAEGCEAINQPQFGTVSGNTVCMPSPEVSEVTFRGLFGDAWFSCSLRAKVAVPGIADDVIQRASEWCVTALDAVKYVASPTPPPSQRPSGSPRAPGQSPGQSPTAANSR